MTRLERCEACAKAATDMVAWVPYADAQRLLGHVNRGEMGSVKIVLRALFGRLPPGFDLLDPDLAEAFADALSWRVMPAVPDPEKTGTEPLPCYEMYAPDLRDAA